MSRLIDADKVYKIFDKFSGQSIVAYELREEVKKIPTVEARPQGEWIFKFDNPLIPTGYWECSECKKGRLLVETKFCPDCGADMRGGENA